MMSIQSSDGTNTSLDQKHTESEGKKRNQMLDSWW